MVGRPHRPPVDHARGRLRLRSDRQDQAVRREATSTIKIQPTLKQALTRTPGTSCLRRRPPALRRHARNSVAVDLALHPRRPLLQQLLRGRQGAAPDITYVFVGQHIQFAGIGSVGGRERSTRTRSGSAAASAQAAPGRRRAVVDRVNALKILDGTLPGDGPSRTSTSGTPTRSRARSRRARPGTSRRRRSRAPPPAGGTTAPARST